MKNILINENPWQTRIAITRDELLQNIYFSSHADQTLERSFFKGTVSKILPGTQTAFINIGQEKAGFLHISEIDRELALLRMAQQDELEEENEDTPRQPLRHELDISKILTEGQAILVQVSKEPINEKGAKLTTCFTLPGRFVVLMPNIPRIGISKKIEEREERQRLRDLLQTSLPEGMGAIIRTTCEYQGAQEILQDLKHLINEWENIQKRFANAQPQEKIHEDIDPCLQAVRDHLDNDVENVVCDNKETHNKIYKFVKSIAPEHAHKIKFYEGPQPLFEKCDIEKQIEMALSHKAHLKSGGSIVIESTEAMTVIDVNTGRYTGHSNLEETILKTNLEAAQEIVRQLRLRNIGGLIVIDFIDMATGANRQKLFKTLEKTLKERDKFQSVVLRVSEFGLVQMTRKRSGKTLSQQMTDTCSTCKGMGQVKSIQTESYAILRALKETCRTKKRATEITLSVHQDILSYIINTEYNAILQLEKTYKLTIVLLAQTCEALNDYDIIIH